MQKKMKKIILGFLKYNLKKKEIRNYFCQEKFFSQLKMATQSTETSHILLFSFSSFSSFLFSSFSLIGCDGPSSVGGERSENGRYCGIDLGQRIVCVSQL